MRIFVVVIILMCLFINQYAKARNMSKKIMVIDGGRAKV